MPKYKNIPIREEQHKRLKLMATLRGLSMAELVYRGLDLIEAQNELPHPTDGKPVKIVYIEKREP